MDVKILISLSMILFFWTKSDAQLVNDGCNITVQDGALLHVQGDFTNQGGLIFNQGLIELGGDWLNVVSGNPLGAGTGTISLLGMNQVIGGGFNTLFYTLNLNGNQRVRLDNTIGIERQFNLGGGSVELNGNVLHLLNPDRSALPFSQGGGLISRTAMDRVRWDIGMMANGQYQLPFITALSDAIPLSFRVSRQGVGQNGYLLFSTYATDVANRPLPSTVTNINIDGDGSGLNSVDRFWSIEAMQYSVDPVSTLSFSYEPDAARPPNDIAQADLQVVRWDQAMARWDGLNSASLQNNVAAGEVDSYGDFTLAEDTRPRIIDCPDNIVVDCGTSGGAVVDWDPPSYVGSCSSCDQNASIPGYFYMGTFDDQSYYCSLGTATWPEAQAMAQNLGGQLARIDSHQENSFLSSKVLTSAAWIGLSDHMQEGTFTWTDGASPSYVNWHPGQPNNYGGGQDYVSLFSNGLWNDDYNYSRREFIVELPCSGITQVSGPESGSTLGSGSYTVTYSATDACGGASTCSFSVNVNGGLVVECPSDMIVQADGAQGATCSWAAPSASTCCDACSGATDITGFVYMGSMDGAQYYCSLGAETWDEANAICQANGGRLAIIRSASQNAFVASRLIADGAWIATDSANEGQFTWVDGSPLSYTRWAGGQPNNYAGEQNYLQLFNTGEWNVQRGYLRLEYVMEIPSCVNVTQVTGPTPGERCSIGTHTVSYQISDACGDVRFCNFNITVTPPSMGDTDVYCVSGGMTQSHYIHSMSIDSYLNTSGNNQGYGDFSQNPISISGNQFFLRATRGTTDPYPQSSYWTFWIDYNQDGDFQDNYEFIGYGRSSGSIGGVVAVPYLAQTAHVRLRCIVSESNFVLDPCESFSDGETEDYTLIFSNDLIGDAGTTRTRENPFIGLTLEGESYDRDMEVYPNPVDDVLSIKIGESSNDVQEIFLLNSKGEKVRSKQDLSQIGSWIVSDLQDGVYLIMVRYNDNGLVTRKVVVQH